MDDQEYVEDEETFLFIEDAGKFARALDVISVSGRKPADKRTDILKLVDSYYDLARKKAISLHESRVGAKSSQRQSVDAISQNSMEVDEGDNDGKGKTSTEARDQCELEVQTWDLLRRLLPLRFPERAAAQPARRKLGGSDLWAEFLQSDFLAQERKAVLETLQTTADETRLNIDDMAREYQQQAERGEIIAFGWLHTRAAIKMQKNVTGWSGPLDANSAEIKDQHTDSNGAPLVTQLDPDVVTRQGRKLQPQDEYFERAIWLGCYELLRRGRSMAEIQDWCVERTEVWRAVSMSPMPLARDSEGERPVTDPLAALLWRRTCYAVARQGGTDNLERAVYGILAGDIQSVEKMCQSWDDFVFAHYNALLRSQFDNWLLEVASPETTQAVTQSFPSFNAEQFYGDAATAGERLVSSLEANPTTTKEAKTPMKSLQAAILSDTIQQYLYDSGIVLGEQANQWSKSALISDFGRSQAANLDSAKFFRLNDQNALRLLVHVYLLMSSLDELQAVRQKDDKIAEAGGNLVAAYVSALRLNNMVELIPLYCSKLKRERSFFTLSRNLSGVVEVEERRTILRIMEKLGMDIAKFVVFQPRSLLKEFPEDSSKMSTGRLNMFTNEPPSLKYGRRLRPDFLGEEPDALDPIDERLIQSMEWMMLVDGLWDETFSVGVAIYKRFLKSFNIHAARALSQRVKGADIFRAKAGIMIAEENDISWFTAVDESQEIMGKNGSPQNLTTARNYLDLECLVRVLDSMETIASSAGITHDSAGAQPTRDFWTHVGAEVKLVKSLMRSMLKDWLKYSLKVEPDYELLRDLYLPEVIIGYVSVLHFAGTSLSRDNLMECMELAAVIAEKDSDAASVLMKSGRMKEIVESFANCSKALAVSGSDKKAATGASSKKMRELGWSRELWSVKR